MSSSASILSAVLQNMKDGMKLLCGRTTHMKEIVEFHFLSFTRQPSHSIIIPYVERESQTSWADCVVVISDIIFPSAETFSFDFTISSSRLLSDWRNFCCTFGRLRLTFYFSVLFSETHAQNAELLRHSGGPPSWTVEAVVGQIGIWQIQNDFLSCVEYCAISYCQSCNAISSIWEANFPVNSKLPVVQHFSSGGVKTRGRTFGTNFGRLSEKG